MGFLTDNATGEQPVLTTFVLQQLAQIRTTVHGLDDEQLRSTPSASALSLAELLHHTAETARSYAAMVAAAGQDGADVDHAAAWPSSPEPGITVSQALAHFDRCVEATRAALEPEMDLSALVEVPEAPWFPEDLTHWERRWVLAHLVAEIARHAGHADIVRESIDGRGSYELNDLAEGKEPVDWAALSQK